MIKEFFEKNKIFLTITLTALIIGGFIFLPSVRYAEARQGCCSWHGGVCGCRCCDGTPLSAKCAPYYPHCYVKPAPKYEPPAKEPPAKEQLSEQSVEQPPASQESSPTLGGFTAEIPKEDGGGGSVLGWTIGLGVVGYLFYLFKKRKEK